MKAGFRTTEFWVTLATVFFGFLNTMGVLPAEFPVDETTTWIASSGVLIAYIISRAWVKGKNGTTPPPTT